MIPRNFDAVSDLELLIAGLMLVAVVLVAAAWCLLVVVTRVRAAIAAFTRANRDDA